LALLETRGLSIRFGGHLAVSDVDLDVEAGAVTGLIGPNGAGKTTTFNLICGVLAPTGGRVVLDGKQIGGLSTHERARRGIGRTFQRLEIFGSMTARDNVLVAAEIRRGWGRTHPVGPQLLAGEEDLSLNDEVDLLIERLGLADVADVRAGQLPTGQARLVEIARALAIRPRVLLLDEPASGLDDAESVQLGELMVQLAQSGLAILLVEHDVSLVMRVCAHVYVLDFGSVIDHGTAEHVQQSVVVRDAYLGSTV
jgi:branched-chain amino acid transport system ATP-binding protein